MHVGEENSCLSPIRLSDAQAYHGMKQKPLYSKFVESHIAHDVWETWEISWSVRSKWWGYVRISSIYLPPICKHKKDRQLKWHNCLTNQLAHRLSILTSENYPHTLHTLIFILESHYLFIFLIQCKILMKLG